MELNKIFVGYVILITALLFGVYYIVDNLIMIDFETISDKRELFLAVERKLILFFTLSTLLYFLVANRLASIIIREISKIDTYLDNIQNKVFSKKLKLSYSIELKNIGLKLDDVINRLEKLNKKKRKLNAKLKIANYQQEKLLGAISHELKNPLSSIMGYSQIIREELLEEKISQTYIKFIDKILNNGKRIDELLNRLRLAVQLENNKFELNYHIFDLSFSIEKFIHSLGGNWKDRRIVFQPHRYELYADKTLIELVIVNLLENGLKYSNSDVFVKIDGDILKVEDFGVGIEESELSSVTKRFYRSDKSSHQQSMGLGLAIVSYILKLHNLELSIMSEVGRGSIFSIDLKPIKNRELPKEFKPLEKE
jgi:signal transduction histidine kinase